jgi:PelA/Pel-15E family pectate lyase
LKKLIVKFFVVVLLMVTCGSKNAAVLGQTATHKIVVVDQKGGGDFTSIQDAINSLPDAATAPRIIYIKAGIYKEKIFLEKDFVSLIGEDVHKTIITISLARDIWRCENDDDWGVAAINLKSNDIVLENLTFTNTYGFERAKNTEPEHIDCRKDSLHPFKEVRNSAHQMALRSFTTTRLVAKNCIFRAYGGDTVSPWNPEEGMFYFKDCIMEGGVDFYCPRGWAWAQNCTFIAHGNTAAIWHDGSKYEDSKTVLVNCNFTGDDGFKLGRYHRDAQFYFINGKFAKEMADAPVYLNPSNPQNEIKWGRRIYFYNAIKEGTPFAWLVNNLETAKGSPKPADITLNWLFNGKWMPDTAAIVINVLKSGAVLKTKAVEQTSEVDAIAENMLVYQRAIGGWPKAVNEIKVDYTKQLDETERKAIIADSLHIDPTIDNGATTKEIKYLVSAYKKTKNNKYLAAAEKGIAYLLKAQYATGGWPQYFPDFSSYRSQITYNDDAMVNVLNLLQDITEGAKNFDVVNPAFIPKAKLAIELGVGCILRTQIKVNDILTAWCAQYNRNTLQPEMARKFELVSISGQESVGIIRFLMRQKNPSPEIIAAIKAGINWLELVKIKGYKYVDIEAPEQPKGKDRIIATDINSTIWARFYEIETNRPFFCGRDSQKKYDVKEIEHERRTGYAWYGTWPATLLAVEYPKWLQTINKNN